VELLVNAGVDKDAKNMDALTSLHIAAVKGHEQ
jgi:ankyrin repeat protein